MNCPHCGRDHVHRIRNGKLFRCRHKAFAKQFAVRAGTVMDDSPLPCRKWLLAMNPLFGRSPDGIASTRVAELIGVAQKTTWAHGSQVEGSHCR